MRRLFKIVLILFVILAGLFLYVLNDVVQESKRDSTEKAEAIVVLGAAQYAGKPSPILRARLDHALELYKDGRAPLIITTGGSRDNEKYSEGGAGKKYLVEHGVPDEAILVDNQSQTTKQNMTRVEEFAKERAIKKIVVVSDPFHMYRGLLIGRSMHLDVIGSPTRTSPIGDNTWIEWKYIFREVVLVVAHTLFDV